MAVYVIPFESLRNSDVGSVGGKNASLGEMISQLNAKGVRVPTGFATTAEAFNEFLQHKDLGKKIVKLLKDSKLKVQGSIQGDSVRVSGAKRDVLQEAIALLKNQITDYPLNFENFRD